MAEKFSEKVSNVLAREGESEIDRLMADSIRVLAVYHGVSWKSEVIPDLIKLYRFLGVLKPLNPKDLDKALERLKAEGLVSIERRVRGAFDNPWTFEDELIRLVDSKETLRALREDEKFMNYVRERYRRMLNQLHR
ncbi:hypothetical protein J7L06_03340 [Candidatus Bathyarchaeota archaeon]|nr:hypothetical protein [Candidatus Bathyarchaeota archaeon]